MSFVTISDIHIKTNSDQSSELLKSFFCHPKVLESDEVYFLGDIFDLMIGPHEEFFKKYSVFFEGILKLISMGKIVYYFEGNHDFHLEKLFDKFRVINKIKTSNLIYNKSSIEKEIFNKKYYLSHGDDLELGNIGYKRYKNFITSGPLNFLANKIVPYKLLKIIGENASSFSRKNNNSKYDNPEGMSFVKENFRLGAASFSENHNVDFIICGHSHIQDDFLINKKTRYLNNGFLPKTKSFIYINNNQVEFISLS